MSGGRAVDAGAAASPAGFDDWVAPHLVTLRRYALVVDPTRDPDDLVQDALERAWLRRETYSPERGSARTWLLAIVADRARRRRVRSSRPELVELDAASADRSGEWSERVDVRRAVGKLPGRQRLAVLLFYYVDLSVEDTAAAMGCAPGTVKSTLSDARARLATMLGERS